VNERFLAQIIIVKEREMAVKSVAYPSYCWGELIHKFFKIIFHKWDSTGLRLWYLPKHLLYFLLFAKADKKTLLARILGT